MSYKLRLLLEKERIREFTLELYSKHKLSNNKKITVYLGDVNSCLNKIYGDIELYDLDNGITYQEKIDNCFKNHETDFLNYLKKEKVISCKFNMFEATDLYADILIKDNKFFTHMAKWAHEFQYIITYGLFSLNKRTGEAYCENSKYNFTPGTGLYSVFKELLIRDQHYLSFREVYLIQQKAKNISTEKKSNVLSDIDIKKEAEKRIKKLKFNLSMNKGLGKLISIYEGKGYLLTPQKL